MTSCQGAGGRIPEGAPTASEIGILQVKTSAGWRNDDGSVILPHELRRYACMCGWVGCWYARDENAQRSFDRHIEKHEREAVGS